MVAHTHTLLVKYNLALLVTILFTAGLKLQFRFVDHISSVLVLAITDVYFCSSTAITTMAGPNSGFELLERIRIIQFTIERCVTTICLRFDQHYSDRYE